MRNNQNFIRYWLPILFWMGLIFWVSGAAFSSQNTFSVIAKVIRFIVPGISSNEIFLIHKWIRKLGHLVEYFVLGLLLFRAFRGRTPGLWNWRWSFYAMTIVIGWAFLDEFHQSFVLTRTASVVDAGIDTAGGLLAQCFGMFRFYWKNGKNGPVKRSV